MFGRKSAERGFPKHEEIVLHKVMEQVEKVLRQMQTEGKDLTRVRIKRFQKTHHVSCRCQQCKLAEEKKDCSFSQRVSTSNWKTRVSGASTLPK